MALQVRLRQGNARDLAMLFRFPQPRPPDVVAGRLGVVARLEGLVNNHSNAQPVHSIPRMLARGVPHAWADGEDPRQASAGREDHLPCSGEPSPQARGQRGYAPDDVVQVGARRVRGPADRARHVEGAGSYPLHTPRRLWQPHREDRPESPSSGEKRACSGKYPRKNPLRTLKVHLPIDERDLYGASSLADRIRIVP